MADRYYVATPPANGQATLDGAEAHHLLHVMRARRGDQLTLFDGNGGEYAASVESCDRSKVRLTTGQRQDVSRELAIRLVFGVALPKGDRQKWLVEKLTELGAAELVPLTCERSVADLKGKSLERLQRGVIEASKQCGRNQLMRIAPQQPVTEFLESAASTKLLAHPTGNPVHDALRSATDSVAVVIGPEGGLTDEEVQSAADLGWQTVGLGASILRIETAAVALAAVLASWRL